ncbi:NADH dehydrogenase [ubiquinone] 1 subunit C2 isoform X1 [Anser cygnoides]|uniref:NADH dehydrogenase [ubiquinone] 1 subunit C2 isoform X1 n=1 Tax=Anser cygnoides TaxID=8845 RepID=UPI0034D23050
MEGALSPARRRLPQAPLAQVRGRPPVTAATTSAWRRELGVHRQVLFATVGWVVGYFLAKRTEYIHAKQDREMFEYIRHHPEDFKTAGKKRIGELLEDFIPNR